MSVSGVSNFNSGVNFQANKQSKSVSEPVQTDKKMSTGMKIGLANCVILFVLMAYGIGWAALVSLVRIVIINSLFGSLTWAVFSLVGATLSLLIMWVLKRLKAFSVIGISLAGGVAHNLGQTIVAMLLFENLGMIYYFPVLILFGLGAGILVGAATGLVYTRVFRL